MKHLGNICKINGAKIDPVDVIIGGSPCQNLSVAGNRKGLQGEQSSLFMEQIRVVKEMYNATNGKQPRYMVWENVPGAFSSNKGEDFRIVLEETARIKDKTTTIPRPEKGKWSNSGAIMGDGWSIAWRVFDAQFWGVPQRRRRISLIADFRGQSAPEILFECESVSGNLKKIQGKTKETSSTIEKSLDDPRWNKDINIEPAICLNDQGGERMDLTENITGTLRAGMVGNLPIVLNKDSMDKVNMNKQELFENHGKDCRYNGPLTVAPTISASYGTGGNNVPLVSSTTNKKDYCISANIIGRQDHNGGNGCGFQEDISYTLTTNDIHAVYNTEKGYENKLVRRLTPLECERLQGFPDEWTDISPQTETTTEDLSFWREVWDNWCEIENIKPKTDKQIIKWLQSKPADTARYKALGNSIALPSWYFVLNNIRKNGSNTMGSLFDGIGGFPKIWRDLGGNTVWSSEIEPFPIAVTRYHFRKPKTVQ